MIENSGKTPYTKPNFPNNLIDTVFLLIMIILVNATSGLAPFITCFSLYFIRVILAVLLKYERGIFYTENVFVLLSSTSISLAMMLGKITSMYFLMLLC